ncbi:MAG: NUDIX domain-containing protein [Candidatus Liptonbacteria bacterium]|nr:NUDIX domain-containing protein [Candidatus Liptonbacteria bacterium]
MKKFRPVIKPIPEKIYRIVHNSLPIVCADIVVSDGRGRFLMVKRKNEPEKGKWWFPGGRILKNETLREGAIRKLAEETGLKPKRVKELGVYEYFNPTGYFRGTNTHAIAFPFYMEISAAKVKLDAQSSDWKWFDRASSGWHPYLKYSLKRAGFPLKGKKRKKVKITFPKQ